MRERGKLITSPYAEWVIATIHPSSILRATHADRAAQMQTMLLPDLKLAIGLLGKHAAIESF